MVLHHKAKRMDNGEEIKGFLTKMWGQYHIITEKDENTSYPVEEDTIEPCFDELKNGLFWDKDVIFSRNLSSEESSEFVRLLKKAKMKKNNI